MGRTVARRGLAPGRESRVFTAEELLAALRPSDNDHTVYAELDAAGWLVAAGGRGAGADAGGALLAANARLAPDHHARTATLTLAAAPTHHDRWTGSAPHVVGPWLRLAVAAELAPHDELLLWPDAELAAAARLPHLAPTDIRGRGAYACHKCDTTFEHPNPLKMHLLLSCGTPEPAAFWRRLLRNLQPPVPTPPPYPTPDAEALEALAAAWGRARGGHLCLYCGKMYSRKYGLKIHIRTHTGYKPLRCRYCARAFGDPSNLNKHVRLHDAPGPTPRHACPACGAVLARRRDLLRHVRARHPPAR